MKIQALFCPKDKSKELKFRLLQFLFGAFRFKLYGQVEIVFYAYLNLKKTLIFLIYLDAELSMKKL